VLAVVANKLLSQGEAKQNTFVVWGIVAFLAVVLGGLGLMMSDRILAVAPPALALVAAFVWLALRAKKRNDAERLRQAAKHGTKVDEGKTEPLPKL
jgi:CHASE2 domain-containing sensor protein